jgi:hypothetical protein
MNFTSRKTICVIQILLVLLTVGCGLPGGLRKRSNTNRPAMLLKSSDQACQVNLPAGWAENKELHDSAELEAANEPEEMYLIIMQESKGDFGEMTIEQHSKITREILLEALSKARATEPISGTLDGHPSLQCEIRGTAENINIVYMHTTVETATRYYQILAWTLSSRFEKNRSKLQEIIDTFHELS